MAHPKYANDIYMALRKGWAGIVAQGEVTCHEPIWLMDSRTISPGEPWDMCHDPTGTRILGPGHRKCNRREAATRGNITRGNRFLTLKAEFLYMQSTDDPGAVSP